MTLSRKEFLERIRQAVAAGNRAGADVHAPERGTTGYQGAGPDRVAHFMRELEAVGGKAHLAESRESLLARLNEILQPITGRRILLEVPPFLEDLDLANQLTALGKEVTSVPGFESTTSQEAFFAADVGITGVECLIAETGSMVMASASRRPRSTSLLPPVHIAIAGRTQILPDLFDLFSASGALPSCLTVITGPSKTGDIELRLVTGVHGPGAVHVVICTWA